MYDDITSEILEEVRDKITKNQDEYGPMGEHTMHRDWLVAQAAIYVEAIQVLDSAAVDAAILDEAVETYRRNRGTSTK